MMETKAFSALHVKAVDDDKRIIRGIATTPTPDRVGDIVDPMGVKFQNPTVLLWMHDHSLPVGTVNFGKATEKGIPFEARIPVIDAPSQLKARVDEAWESVKSGIVAAVSIGFRAVEWSVNEATGGLNFLKSDILELSLVSVPANPEAKITGIKSLDAEIRKAALGNKTTLANKTNLSGVTEKKTQPVKIQKERQMSLSEKLKGFSDELKTKKAKLVEMTTKSIDAGETFDDADQEQFDTLQAEVESLEKHIERVKFAMKHEVADAKPVVEKDGQSEKAAAMNRLPAKVKAAQTLEKGIGFARLARCKALAKMTGEPATEIARSQYGEESQVYGVLKAAVSAGTTLHSTWAAPLVGDESSVYADFAEYLRPMTILGRMGQGGIPAVRRVPFRTRLITQTSGGSASWVGEGAAKPLTKFDFTGTTLEPLKVANIAVVTMELLRDSSPSAEAIVRDSLAAALAERLDLDFLDPTKTAVNNVSPASVTNGVTPITASGTDADAVRCDIASLLQTYAAANNPPMSGVIVMSASVAISLMAMRNALGQREFPELTMNGGILEGIPVLTSQYLDQFDDSQGKFIFMINASDIYLGDEGGVSVDMSDQASLQMDSTPTQNGTSPTATSVVSLWQNNLVGFRAERTINWAKRRASAVAVLDGVNYTACPAS